MAAIASCSRPALDAASTPSFPTAACHSYPPANAPSNTPASTSVTSPPRLLVRLPQQPEVDGRRHPLKRKWRSFVNFFALPIRSYYLEPPGLAYRTELRFRRANPWDDADHPHSFWPVPAYTDQVGDDEMILFKAHEEAEALAAMQRDQQAAAAARAEQGEAQHSDLSDDVQDDNYQAHDVEQLASPLDWPQTPPTAASMSAFHTFTAEPSPRYEIADPFSTFPLDAQRPPMHNRTRTSSNSAAAAAPTLTNGIAMSRHASTPLAPTLALSSSPPTPLLSSSVFQRRRRAQTNAAVRPTLAARNISEPLSWTLVRSQYSYPKRGLTPQQLAFLSSVESLGRFGVAGTPDVAPSPAYESSPRTGANDYGFPIVPADPN